MPEKDLIWGKGCVSFTYYDEMKVFNDLHIKNKFWNVTCSEHVMNQVPSILLSIISFNIFMFILIIITNIEYNHYFTIYKHSTRSF